MPDSFQEAMRQSVIKRASTAPCYFCEISGDFNRTLFYWKNKSTWDLECACDNCKKLIKKNGGKKYEPR